MKKSDNDRGSKTAGRTNRQREREDESNRHECLSDGEDDSNRQNVEEMDPKLARKLLRCSKHSNKSKNKRKHSAQLSDASSDCSDESESAESSSSSEEDSDDYSVTSEETRRRKKKRTKNQDAQVPNRKERDCRRNILRQTI